MSADDPGQRIQSNLDAVELAAAARPFGSALLGIALAAAVVFGGMIAFLVVFVLLVGVIR
jgi:hypothetical protein